MPTITRKVVEIVEDYKLPYYDADLCLCEFKYGGVWVKSDTPYIISRTDRILSEKIQALNISDAEKEELVLLIENYSEDNVSERAYDMEDC